MKTNFKKGPLKGLTYYVIGIAIVWLTYSLFGWNYKHAPGLHHIVVFLFLLGGVGSILYYLVLVFTGLKSNVNFGVLVVHFVIILSVVLYFVIDSRGEDASGYKTDPADVITLSKDTATKISLIVTGDGDTLYAMKGDSVLIDKIGSDTINHR